MDGNKVIINQLFNYAQEVMEKYKIYPYVAFITKKDSIIAKGHNLATSQPELYGGDITLQGDVVAIRNAQQVLKTGNLSGYTLVSFMEPTILGFDVALWAGIKDFVWCVNSFSIPQHYNNLGYTPLDYLKKHKGEITINNGVKEKEALMLVLAAQKNNYYPDNLV